MPGHLSSLRKTVLRSGVHLLSWQRKAGIYGMIGGQVIDVKETGHAVSKDVLDTIYELKTGALIECCNDDRCNPCVVLRMQKYRA